MILKTKFRDCSILDILYFQKYLDRVLGSNLIANYSKSQQFCVLLHILLERGHFDKINCEIKLMELFNTAKKSEF